MVNTYTYTARSAENPEKVITFTLDDEHLRVNFTGMFEKLGQLSRSEDKPETLVAELKTHIEPSTLKFAEAITGPVHVRDVEARLNGSLTLNAWPRVKGLRLAPVTLTVSEVDNPDAAEAFVSELEIRQKTAEQLERRFGLFDYWIGWLGFGLVIFSLFRWWRKKDMGPTLVDLMDKWGSDHDSQDELQDQ